MNMFSLIPTTVEMELGDCGGGCTGCQGCESCTGAKKVNTGFEPL